MKQLPEPLYTMSYWFMLAMNIPCKSNREQLLLDVWLTVKVHSYLRGIGVANDLFLILQNSKPNTKLVISHEEWQRAAETWRNNYDFGCDFLKGTTLREVVDRDCKTRKQAVAMRNVNHQKISVDNSVRKAKKMYKRILDSQSCTKASRRMRYGSYFKIKPTKLLWIWIGREQYFFDTTDQMF